MPGGRILMLAGGAIALLSMLGFLWFFLTYGIFDPSPSWIAPVVVAGGYGGFGLVIFGAIKLVIETLRA